MTTDGKPLILDSAGDGARDANGEKIPDGVHLRPFSKGSWYAAHADHAIRIINP
jgi:hypothetical protein